MSIIKVTPEKVMWHVRRKFRLPCRYGAIVWFVEFDDWAEWIASEQYLSSRDACTVHDSLFSVITSENKRIIRLCVESTKRYARRIEVSW